MFWVGLITDDVWFGLNHDMEELENKEFFFLKKNFLARRLENVLKTSSEDERLRRTYSSWWRRLLKTKTKDIFKSSSRRLHQDECLLGCILNHLRNHLHHSQCYWKYIARIQPLQICIYSKQFLLPNLSIFIFLDA